MYFFPHPCRCQVFLRGFLATSSKPSSAHNAAEPGASLVETAPAYGRPLGPVRTGDWPTFRGNPRRGAATEVSAPSDLEQLWSLDLGGRLTAPTVGNGTVFVASRNAYQVYAVHARDGKLRWRYTTGGPVEAPPTVYRGLCLIGSNDGWVDCLRAGDGQLVWRIRAAPHDRLICSNGRLESAWPVRGGVLVGGGVAYFAAGRHSGAWPSSWRSESAPGSTPSGAEESGDIPAPDPHSFR